MKKTICLVFSAVLFLSACGEDEKQARSLLNEGLKAWLAGDVVTATTKFDQVEQAYLGTRAATDLIKEREQLLQAYKAEFDPGKSHLINQGELARKILEKVELYSEQFGFYPKSLDDLPWDSAQASAHYCEYRRAEFDIGFQLDCALADKVTTKEGLTSMEAVRLSQNYRGGVIGLDQLPRVERTWGARLNPDGAVPEKGFKVFYLNTKNPDLVRKLDVVDVISVDYVADKFLGIDSQDFGAYWVGYLDMDEAGTREISIDQSWAKTRLIIDGALVYKGGSDHRIKVHLEKGRHLVEIEYVNNWHTTDFLVLFDPDDKLSYRDLQDRLRKDIGGDYDVLLASVQKASGVDDSVVVNLKKSDRDIVVILGSNDNVNWYVSNRFDNNISAIVLASNQRGSSVRGDFNERTPILEYDKNIGYYTIKPKCSCHTQFSCGGVSLLSTRKRVEALTAGPLVGFSGAPIADVLNLPEVVLNDELIADLHRHAEQISLESKACKQQNDPDFEKLLGHFD